VEEIMAAIKEIDSKYNNKPSSEALAGTTAKLAVQQNLL
jgi:hypothetical protein